MTIDIFVLKGDLNRENRSGAFLFLLGIFTCICLVHVDLIIIGNSVYLGIW